MALGFFLRTAAARDVGFARMAGPRASHADVTFPICPACRVATSPIFRIDFRTPPLDALALWDDLLIALICHNGCEAADRCRWWDHRDPLRPVELDPQAIAIATGYGPGRPEDFEFEELALSLEPRLTRDPDRLDISSRVGGEPAWLQRGYDMRDDGTVVAVEPDPPSCPRCAKPTAMLVQWHEGAVSPRRATRVGRAWRFDDQYVMVNPFVRFWFGCAACKLVGSLAQLD